MPENRRQFLKATTAVTALGYGSIMGANDRIRLGGLGCGGRGQYLLRKALDIGGCEVVAACDVYQPRIRQTQAFAPRARAYGDHRELLESKEVDAVIIGSPNHWHVPMTIDSIQAGKDVYVEKPVTHTIAEGEDLKKAVAGSDRVVQVGYQQRSWDHFIEARDVVRSGRLGKITLILTSWYQTWLGFDPADAEINAREIDWKRWLGNAPDRPLSGARYLRWRWFWDYGGGHLTDLYSHWGDTLHWFMGVDHPLSALSAGGRYAFTFQDCPDTMNTFWEYPGQFAIVYNGAMNCHLDGGNIRFRGDRAMMVLNRQGFTVYREGVVPKESTAYPKPDIRRPQTRDGARDHVANFLDCVRSRKQPNSTVADAVGAANAAHLGNLSYRKDKRLRWPV